MAREDAARVASIQTQIAKWHDGKQERGRLWLWTEMALVCDALVAAEVERDDARAKQAQATKTALRCHAQHKTAEAERDQQAALVRQWDERDHAKTVRIAELEQERDALLREMDKGCAGMLLVAHALGVYSEMGKGPWPPWEVLRQRATRLEKLAAAARALDDTMQWPRDRTVACTTVPVDNLRVVHDALVALAVPPGEATDGP